jgi:hypothetical protein
MKFLPNNHKPQLINPHSWPDIQQHYINLNNHGWQLDPLLELVRHIIASKLAARLFAYTSLDNLVIGIFNPMEPHRETLHLKFDSQLQQWFYKYYPKPGEPVEWERQYPADKGIEKFESFIRMIRW